jgi:hypothetical protein
MATASRTWKLPVAIVACLVLLVPCIAALVHWAFWTRPYARLHSSSDALVAELHPVHLASQSGSLQNEDLFLYPAVTLDVYSTQTTPQATCYALARAAKAQYPIAAEHEYSTGVFPESIRLWGVGGTGSPDVAGLAPVTCVGNVTLADRDLGWWVAPAPSGSGSRIFVQGTGGSGQIDNPLWPQAPLPVKP